MVMGYDHAVGSGAPDLEQFIVLVKILEVSMNSQIVQSIMGTMGLIDSKVYNWLLTQGSEHCGKGWLVSLCCCADGDTAG